LQWEWDFSLFLVSRARSLTFGLTQEKLRQILLRPGGIAFVCESKMIPPAKMVTDDRTSIPEASKKKVLATTLCHQWAENCALSVQMIVEKKGCRGAETQVGSCKMA
jgi:hypothetical protein